MKSGFLALRRGHAPSPVHHGAGRVVYDPQPSVFAEAGEDSIEYFARELTRTYQDKLEWPLFNLTTLYDSHRVPLCFHEENVNNLLETIRTMVVSYSELLAQRTPTEVELKSAVARSLDLAKLPLELLYFILRFAQPTLPGIDNVVRSFTTVSFEGWTLYCSLLKKLYALYKVNPDAAGMINRHRIRAMLNKDATLMDLFRTLEFPCVKRALPQDSYGLIVADATLRTHDKFVQLISARRNVVADARFERFSEGTARLYGEFLGVYETDNAADEQRAIAVSSQAVEGSVQAGAGEARPTGGWAAVGRRLMALVGC